MPLYIRKRIKIAPGLSVNISKSGLGLSAGPKGFKISHGPRGTQLNAGRGGIYYRKSLNGKRQQQKAAQPQPGAQPAVQALIGQLNGVALDERATRRLAPVSFWVWIAIAVLLIVLAGAL